MSIITEIERNIKRVLLEDADRLARQSGFIKRQRVLTGRLFANILVWGALDKPEMSYTDMSQNIALFGTQMSPQGVAQRFGRASAEFMRLLLEQVVKCVIDGDAPRHIPVLRRFQGIYLRDSTRIRLPDVLQREWDGGGDRHGDTAGLKLQVRLDYSQGQLEGPILQAGRQHDRRTPVGPDNIPAGSLSLADLGYFSLDEMAEQDKRGQYFLIRYKVGTAIFTPDGERMSLVPFLRRCNTDTVELTVTLGAQKRLPMRLLAYRVSQEVAEQRRRRLRTYARKKQQTPTRESLFLAGWVVLLTNAPAEKLAREEALVIIRVRWQIELLFRLWKSHVRIDEWRSQNPWRILSELYAKLIAVTILHWLLLLQWGQQFDLSLFKAAQAVQKIALALGLTLFTQQNGHYLLTRLVRILQTACHQNKRRAKPATFQLLCALGEP